MGRKEDRVLSQRSFVRWDGVELFCRSSGLGQDGTELTSLGGWERTNTIDLAVLRIQQAVSEV